MRDLDEPAEWSNVTVFEPGQDAYGPWVVDGPVASLTRRTEYLFELISNQQNKIAILENRIAELES